MPSTPHIQRHQADSERGPLHGLASSSGPTLHSKLPIVHPYRSDTNSYALSSKAGSNSHSEAKYRGEMIGKTKAPIPSTSQFPHSSTNGKEALSAKEENGEEETKAVNDQQFELIFKSLRARAWEKSRRIDDDDTTILQDELLEQLRPEEEGLIPLNAIAGRVVLYGWQLFANQVEINPSISFLKRRKMIYDDAHEARKQLIKLLVLIQWSKVAPELTLARSLIAFINDHFVQTDAAVTALAETRQILNNAKLRNYDLATAIEVLGTSSAQNIPQILWDTAKGQKRYTDQEIINVVKHLDETIRIRLASEEVVPLAMSSYTIADGRVTFSIPTLFEVEVTLSGQGVEDRWWLLKVRFDFTVTGLGTDRFPRHLKKQQRLHLLSIADMELAPRSVAAITEETIRGKDADEPGDAEMRDSTAILTLNESSETRIRRDAPLVRLFNLMQSQALHYQLDILHYQALQMVRLEWGESLSARMETTNSTRVLTIFYWLRHHSKNITENAWMPTKSGSLKISIQPKAGAIGSDDILKQISTRRVEIDDGEYMRGQMADPLHIMVDWTNTDSSRDFVSSKSLGVDSNNLDVSKLILTVVRRHTLAAIRAIKSHLLASKLGKSIHIEELLRFGRDNTKETCLLLHLCEKATIILHIDVKSGQIIFDEEYQGDGVGKSSLITSNSRWRQRLQEATDRVNAKSVDIVQILQNLRIRAMVENLEEQSHLLGLSATSRMPFRPIDYDTIKARPDSILYITLAQCPGYYLLIHMGEDSTRAGLMCAGTFLEDLLTTMRIVSLEWLDWKQVVAAKSKNDSVRSMSLGKRKRIVSNGHDSLNITKETLSLLYSYCIALICYHKIEEQLQSRSVPYTYVGGRTGLRPPPKSRREESKLGLDYVVPSLCIDSANLIHQHIDTSMGAEFKRNISIQLGNWNDQTTAHANFLASLSLDQSFSTPSKAIILNTSREKIEYRSEDGILSFTYPDISNCVEKFVESWRHISKILSLSTELKRERYSKFFTGVSCDLIQVRFNYGQDYLAQLQWNQSSIISSREGSFTLSLSGTDNPHEIILSRLNALLKRFIDITQLKWTTLLDNLQQSFHLAKHLYSISKDSLEKIERPELQVQNATHYQLIFWERYRLDVQLISGNRILFCDATSVVQAEGRHRTSSKIKLKDEFTLESSIKASSQSSLNNVAAESFNKLPRLSTVLTDLQKQYQQEFIHGNQSSSSTITPSIKIPSCLVFSNGLICANEANVIDWIFPRLMQSIREAIDL